MDAELVLEEEPRDVGYVRAGVDGAVFEEGDFVVPDQKWRAGAVVVPD